MLLMICQSQTHVPLTPWPISSFLLCHQLFDDFRQQGWIVLFAQMLDPLGLEAQFFERSDRLLPLGRPCFALSQIEVRDQLAEPLQRDRFAVIVVVFDDFLLVFRVLSTHVFPYFLPIINPSPTRVIRQYNRFTLRYKHSYRNTRVQLALVHFPHACLRGKLSYLLTACGGSHRAQLPPDVPQIRNR